MRLSTATHATAAATAVAHAAASTTGDASVVAVRAKVAAPSASTVSTAPGTSKRPVAAASRLSGALRTSATAARQRGTLIAKIHRQLAWSTSHPPSSGPMLPPPSLSPLPASSVSGGRSDRPAHPRQQCRAHALEYPEGDPCSRLSASAHSTDATMNHSTPTT